MVECLPIVRVGCLEAGFRVSNYRAKYSGFLQHLRFHDLNRLMLLDGAVLQLLELLRELALLGFDVPPRVFVKVRDCSLLLCLLCGLLSKLLLV